MIFLLTKYETKRKYSNMLLHRTEDWTIGFAKLANALYLKDADQDGYLTGEDLRDKNCLV